MGRNSSYLPSTDVGLRGWARNFSTRVSESGGSLGISSARAEELAQALLDFEQAMAGVNPGIRCKSSVSVKNTARQRLKILARLIVATINGQPGLSDQERINLGLTVRAKWSRRSGPADAPIVEVRSVDGHAVRIRVHSAANYEKRARPIDADGASIFTHVGEHEPVTTDDLKFETNISRTTAEIVLPQSLAPGTKVWIAARWFGSKKQSGPMSQPVSTYIQFGGGMRMAA
jgi:hypothetical protein